MDEKFVIKTEFDLKKRIDIVRVFMGRAYYLPLLVAAAVACYNFYLIRSGRALPQDTQKTSTLLLLMAVWAFVPVIVGFVWNTLSKVKKSTVRIFDDRVAVETDSKTYELEPKRLYVIDKRENYLRFGSMKECAVVDLNGITKGDKDKVTEFLMKIKE